MDPLDLKFTPDWLKEESPKPDYRDFKGESDDRPRRDRGDRGDRGGPRPRRPGGERRPARGEAKGPRQRDDATRRERPPHDAVRPAQVSVEFLPDPACSAVISKQIRESGRAYPLVDVARMFLERPERHRVKITTSDAARPLFCCGDDGPLATDRASLEGHAFDVLKEKFYVAEVTLGEPPKGNYVNVARCRIDGTLVAPTNHHSYQPELRRIYSERFSRRMSFSEFQREIEVVTDPAAIEAWKEQARSVTTWRALEEPPETFASEDEARRHFAKTHLPNLIRTGPSFDVSGSYARTPVDPGLGLAVSIALQNERKFPAQLSHHLRNAFFAARLHLFKQGDRRQFISAVRPHPVKPGEAVLAPNVAAILRAVEEHPGCSRRELVDHLQAGEDEARKSAILSDLHWLIGAGHLIEFHDGKLSVPLGRSGRPDRAQPQAATPSEAPAEGPTPAGPPADAPDAA